MSFLETLGHNLKAANFSAKPDRQTPFSAMGGQGSLSSSYAGYQNGFLPGSKRDHAALMGDGLENGVVSACASAIAEGFALAPPYLEKRAADDVWTGKARWERVAHPLSDLLEQPNDHYGSAHLWATTINAQIGGGNGYWRAVFNRARTEPVELWFEPQMRPIYGRETFIDGYEMRVDGKLCRLDAAANYSNGPSRRVDYAIHFRYELDSRNTRLGKSPLLSVSRQVVGDNAGATFETGILLNGAAMSLFVTGKEGSDVSTWSPLTMEKFLADIRRDLKGDGAGGVAGTNQPFDVHKVSYTPEELHLAELLAYFETRICAKLKVPTMVIGLASGQDSKTYSNYAEAIKDFWTRTIIPLQERHGSELEAQLFRLFGLDRTEYRISWDRSQIAALQEDEGPLFESLSKALGGAGFMTADEARERAKLPVMSDGSGKAIPGKAEDAEGAVTTNDNPFDEAAQAIKAAQVGILSAADIEALTEEFTEYDIAGMVESRTPAMRALLLAEDES